MSQPTPEQIAYMQANIHDDKTLDVILAATIPYGIACLAVALRLAARHRKGVAFGTDDYWIIGGLLLVTIYLAVTLLMVKYGLGKHAILITDAESLTIYVVASEIMYAASIVPIKLSILYMYDRLFPSQTLRRISISTGLFVIAYSIGQIVSFGLQCIPLRAMWTGEPATCFSVGTLVTACGVLNVLTDLILLALPVPFLWNLKVSSSAKAGLLATFALGGLTTAFSVVRSVFVGSASHEDPSWNNVPGSIYSSLELNVGILSACLPTLRPIFFPSKQQSSSSAMQFGSPYKSSDPDHELSSPSSRMRTMSSKQRSMAASVRPTSNNGWEFMEESKDLTESTANLAGHRASSAENEGRIRAQSADRDKNDIVVDTIDQIHVV